MVLERLRLRFGVIAAFLFFASIWGAGNVIRRDRLPAYDAEVTRVEETYVYARATGADGRSFETVLFFERLRAHGLRLGDHLTVHCDVTEDTHVCFTGTLTSKLALTAAMAVTCLLAAVGLLFPWLRRWILRDAGPGR